MEFTTPSRYIAACLGIFLGCLGLHQIYLRNGWGGAVWLIICILFSWTVVVPVALAIVGFLQGMTYLFYDDASWERVYGKH